MSPVVLLTYYCLLILAASIVGGMIPTWFRLTHRGLEMAVSFVAGVMLGVALLHMLPHALAEGRFSAGDAAGSDLRVMQWALVGMLAMFFVERFFCFHHHSVEEGEATCDLDHDHAHHDHGHDITWSGAALGLSLHSLAEGIALAASVQHGHATLRLAGLGTFLVILLHKPFDSMTIATLMARGNWPLSRRHLVNALFSLVVPLGAAFFFFGLMGQSDATLGYALAFAAGTFLCISLSDLLPELQFHHHDRIVLSVALLLGLAVAYGICQLETLSHVHPSAIPLDEGPSLIVPQ